MEQVEGGASSCPPTTFVYPCDSEEPAVRGTQKPRPPSGILRVIPKGPGHVGVRLDNFLASRSFWTFH